MIIKRHKQMKKPLLATASTDLLQIQRQAEVEDIEIEQMNSRAGECGGCKASRTLSSSDAASSGLCFLGTACESANGSYEGNPSSLDESPDAWLLSGEVAWAYPLGRRKAKSLLWWWRWLVGARKVWCTFEKSSL